MSEIKALTIITAAKISKFASKILGRGEGTALPGLIIEKYYPELFDNYAKQLKEVVVITGTNGKTTTKALLSQILQQTNKKFITNTAGSNLKRGLLSTFLIHSSLTGKLDTDLALFEVEEATLPKITHVLKPTVIIVTNLFRDQLDAYGEVNKTRSYIEEAITQSPQATLILNHDDPLVSTLSQKTKNKTSYFSIPSQYRKQLKYEGSPKLKAPKKDVLTPTTITLSEKDLSTAFTVNMINYKLNVSGIFHVYNALAALIAARALNISQRNIQAGFKAFQPAFGRGETINRFKIFLIKNPVGFTLTLDMLTKIKRPNLVFIINDKIADGKDVSWLWDAEVEKVKKMNPKTVITSGTRALDMALRLKYALSGGATQIIVESNQKKLLQTINANTQQDEMVYVLPTYTAMNEFRKLLGKNF